MNYQEPIKFPKWKPQRATASRFSFSDYRTRLNAIRHSSSAFIKKKAVRLAVLQAYNGKCACCGSKNGLEIDHIVSVYQVANFNFPIDRLNTKENLQPLCEKCNRRKMP